MKSSVVKGTHVAILLVAGIAVLLTGCERRNAALPSHMSQNKFLNERIVLLGSPIDEQVAAETNAKLLLLEKESQVRPIRLLVNSPGGSVAASLSILKTIKALRPEVHTICVRQAHSTATIIVAAGTPGKRMATADAILSFSVAEAGGPIGPEKERQLQQATVDLVRDFAPMTRMTTNEVIDLFISRKEIRGEEARRLGIVDEVVRLDTKY